MTNTETCSCGDRSRPFINHRKSIPCWTYLGETRYDVGVDGHVVGGRASTMDAAGPVEPVAAETNESMSFADRADELWHQAAAECGGDWKAREKLYGELVRAEADARAKAGDPVVPTRV